MTDELTPEQETAISRLLAEARHDEPIPVDVAARLDVVLGDLSADDVEKVEAVGTGPSMSTVTELAGVRHRRRKAGRLLLAAAAVVVGGVAVGQNLDSTGMDDSDSPSAESGANVDVPREAQAGDPADTSGGATAFDDDSVGGDEAAPAPTSESVDSGTTKRLLDALNTPLSLTSENFEVEVQRNLRDASAERRSAALSNLDAVPAYAADTLFTCPDADYGEGASSRRTSTSRRPCSSYGARSPASSASTCSRAARPPSSRRSSCPPVEWPAR